MDYEVEPPLWAVGASQSNSRIDNFLSGLDIRDWAQEQFIAALCERVDGDSIFHNEPDEQSLSWLRKKSPAWMQELYALLHAEAKDTSYRFKRLLLVRLGNRKARRVSICVLPE